VGSLLDAPAVILLALCLGAAFLLIELALPTMGVAGSIAALLGIAGVVAIDRQDAQWWPLLGPAFGVVLAEVLIARRERSMWVEALGVAVFGAGAVGFGLLADSIGTAAFGLALTVGLAAAFPMLHRAATRLLDRPDRVGMASLVGEHGRVVRWDGRAGTVELQGSLWNAVGEKVGGKVKVDDDVEVVGWAGSTLEITSRK
jgi:membrane-bound ClpP family serine protease